MKSGWIGLVVGLLTVVGVIGTIAIAMLLDSEFGTSLLLLGIAGPFHLASGSKKEYPFSLNIPAGGRESYYGVDANLKWFIKASVDVKERRNLTSGTSEAQITKPPLMPTVIKEKEAITREVVMIQCAYCHGLMPQTSTFCAQTAEQEEEAKPIKHKHLIQPQPLQHPSPRHSDQVTKNNKKQHKATLSHPKSHRTTQSYSKAPN